MGQQKLYMYIKDMYSALGKGKGKRRGQQLVIHVTCTHCEVLALIALSTL